MVADASPQPFTEIFPESSLSRQPLTAQAPSLTPALML